VSKGKEFYTEDMAEDKIGLERLQKASAAYDKILDVIDSVAQAFVSEEGSNLDHFDKIRAQKRFPVVVRALVGRSTKELGGDELYQKDALKKVALAQQAEEYQQHSDMALQNRRAIDWLYDELTRSTSVPLSARGIIQKKGK